MPSVGLATCDWLPDLYPDDAPLVAALEEAGVAAVPSVWTDPAIDWDAFDMVVVRTTWDYFVRRDEFLGWAERIERAVPLWNPLVTIRWNSEKGYLRELEQAGAPVVPTAWVEGPCDLAALLAERGWDDAVLKPAVGAGSLGQLRVRPGEGQEHLDELLRAGRVLVQPFLPSIESDGELSVVCLDGVPSHTVRKRPQAGDIRIQPQYGGTAEEAALDGPAAEAVEAVLAAFGHPALYARVDLVADHEGMPRLMELEAIEPNLFLEAAPGSAERVAAAILDRLP